MGLSSEFSAGAQSACAEIHCNSAGKNGTPGRIEFGGRNPDLMLSELNTTEQGVRDMGLLKDLKRFQPHEALAYAIVLLSPPLVGLAGVSCFLAEAVGSSAYKWILLSAVGTNVLVELAFVAIALAAMYDEIAITLRARAAMLSGSAFYLASSVVGLACAWPDKSAAAFGICLAIGWLILGITIKSDTNALESELEVWRRHETPSCRSSHFYWTRREEIFEALRPVDWNTPPSV